MSEYILIASIILASASIIFVIFLAFFIFVVNKNKKIRADLEKREEDTKRKMYEIAILKELGDRMGYSLNVQNIIDIITGSLRQFIGYSAVSYMFLEPEKIIFKVHLEKSVSRKFIDNIKERMLGSLSALLNIDFKTKRIEEILSGAILAEEQEEPVKSFFNIPLVIAGKVVGGLTIADIKAGLYKEEEMTILYKITQQASQAVTKLQEVVAIEQGKFNAMVSSMAEGVVMTDPDYRILVVNPAAKKAVGLENKKELTIFDFIDKLSGKFDVRGKIEESVKLDKIFLSEEIALQNSFFQIAVSPVKYGNGKDILGCVIIFRDITHEKEVERIKEDFTSMIVHELRSPLDTIKKMVEMMRNSKVKKAEQSEYFQIMHHSSSDMLELINNLLDMAKIEAGKFELKKQPSDIKEIVKDCISFFSIASKDAKVKITSQLAKNIPDKADFDPHTISQVFNNLVSNAVKFSKENGKIIIQVLFHKKGGIFEKESEESGIKWFLKKKITDIPDSLLMTVTNEGKGVSSEEIDKLFNKFVQVKTVFGKKGGTGLGLAISKSIIESHGGIIGVESTEGEKTTFYFTIPA